MNILWLLAKKNIFFNRRTFLLLFFDLNNKRNVFEKLLLLAKDKNHYINMGIIINSIFIKY